MNLSSQTLENIEIRILNSVRFIKSRSGEEASNSSAASICASNLRVWSRPGCKFHCKGCWIGRPFITERVISRRDSALLAGEIHEGTDPLCCVCHDRSPHCDRYRSPNRARSIIHGQPDRIPDPVLCQFCCVMDHCYFRDGRQPQGCAGTASPA